MRAVPTPPARPTAGRLTRATDRRPQTVFVLSGGASLGALQVGMLQALYEHGIVPDALVATSVGALNAAFVASRPPTPATARELGHVWRSLRREDVFPASVSALVGGFCGRRDHLVPDRGLRRLVRRYLEFDDLSDATIPLHLVAVDILEGEELLLSQGPALDAVVAAASVPGVFPPVRIADLRLIDGGVVNNTPISHAVDLGAEKIYVLSTQRLTPAPRRAPRNALDAAMDALGLLRQDRLQADIDRYSQEVELVLLPPVSAPRVQPTSFENSHRLIDEALLAARALLASQNAGRHLRLVASR